jgi:redox-sensing transcriptional repressor
MRAIEQGEEVISSDELGAAAGVPAAQVRKDLNYLGGLGRAGIGYEVRGLAEVLREFLGLSHRQRAIVVGAGNLGRALAAYPGFELYGLQIVALFDIDPAKIGTSIAGKAVCPLDELAGEVLRRDVHMGIITVPADQAQAVADLMVKAGIQVIWNFAPQRLQVPTEVLLENEDLAARVARMSYYITHGDSASATDHRIAR